MAMPRDTTFKRRAAYSKISVGTAEVDTGTAGVDTGTAGVAAGTATISFDYDQLLHWTVQTFFDQLFRLSVGETDLTRVGTAFDALAQALKQHKSPQIRKRVIDDLDFFVGRVKGNIEGMLSEWYAAFKRA